MLFLLQTMCCSRIWLLPDTLLQHDKGAAKTANTVQMLKNIFFEKKKKQLTLIGVTGAVCQIWHMYRSIL